MTNNTSSETTPTKSLPPPSTEFTNLSGMAERLFGSATRSAKGRVVRMADRGELAVIRIGRRGDRLFPVAEISRLHAEAMAARRDAGGTSPAKKQ